MRINLTNKQEAILAATHAKVVAAGETQATTPEEYLTELVGRVIGSWGSADLEGRFKAKLAAAGADSEKLASLEAELEKLEAAVEEPKVG